MSSQPATAATGSHDGEGAGDHDVPFRFGSRPARHRAVPVFHSSIRPPFFVLRSQAEAGSSAPTTERLKTPVNGPRRLARTEVTVTIRDVAGR